MTKGRLDRYLVAHDAVTVAIAALCGTLGAVIQGNLWIGLPMAILVAALGILAMRVGPSRRFINRCALALQGVGR